MSSNKPIDVKVKGAADYNGTYKLKTYNKLYYEAVKNVATAQNLIKGKGSIFTKEQIDSAARRNTGNDPSVLEYNDLTPQEKVEYARLSGKIDPNKIDIEYVKVKEKGKEKGYYKVTFKRRMEVYAFKETFGINSNMSRDGAPGILDQIIPDYKKKISRNPQNPSDLDMACFRPGETVMVPIDKVRF